MVHSRANILQQCACRSQRQRCHWVRFGSIRKPSGSSADAEVNIIEVVAGRIATELEREILLREQGILGVNSHATDAIEWQQAQLPRLAPPVGDWEIAARPSSRSRLHGDYYHWYACDDDRTSLTLVIDV